MVVVSRMLLAVILVPLALFAVELVLALKCFKAALILPLVVVCLTFFLGYFALMVGGLMYAICGVVWLLGRRKKSEREKMDLQDL